MGNFKIAGGIAAAVLLFLVFLQSGALRKEAMTNKSFSRGCPWIQATSKDGGKTFTPSFTGCDCLSKYAALEFDDDELSKLGVVLEVAQIPGFRPSSDEIVILRRFEEWTKSDKNLAICFGN